MVKELSDRNLDRYTEALDDAFGDDIIYSRFAQWLKNLKDDVFVGCARAQDSCPLHHYLREHFAVDGVDFRVTETCLHVHRDESLRTGEHIVAIPMPPVARRFVLIVDGGRKRDGMNSYFDEERHPSVTAEQALRYLRGAYEDESDLIAIITLDDDGQMRERRGKLKPPQS